MDLAILQVIAERIRHATNTGGKEVRLSIADAQDLLAAIAYVTAKDNKELREKLKALMNQQAIPRGPLSISGGSFKD